MERECDDGVIETAPCTRGWTSREDAAMDLEADRPVYAGLDLAT